jgi:hypothetical protein
MFNVTYQAGGRFDFPFYPTKGKPFIKGRRVRIDADTAEDTYIIPYDMELLTISIGSSRYNDKDHWSLYVDGELIFDTVYTKDVPEGFYFMVVREVKLGSEIVFKFNNDSGAYKTIWLNYQFLKD